jgi:sterol 3beta-glucosyltransferase
MNTRSPLARYRAMRQCYRPYFRSVPEAVRSHVESAELVIFSPLGVGAGIVADQLGVSCAMAALQPFWPTSDYPSTLLSLASIPRRANRLSHRLADAIVDHALKDEVAAVRTSVGAGTRRADHDAGSSVYRWIWKKRIPVLLAFSELVMPRASDWPDNVAVTGYWGVGNADRMAGWNPEPELAAFLSGSEPVVCFAFGSMIPSRADRTARLIERSVSQLGVRAIVQRGWAQFSLTSSSRILLVENVPHAWLFPRVSAVVHHGGSGTTGAALVAGVPSVATPFFFDQHLWGHRLAELNVGPPPIAHNSMTLKRLTSRIDSLIRTDSMRLNATRLAAGLNAENGMAKAVEALRDLTDTLNICREGRRSGRR